MKKIMLLGGSAQQVVVIETAKKLGYYTVLCDYLSDNPGQFVADKFYLESTTDMDKMLEIAKKEGVSGVLAYASDPAAPTAAYISEKLGLCCNKYNSVNILCNKDKFRSFLCDNGFNTPYAEGFSTVQNALLAKSKYQLPVIVKPVDSSGSKGATVLHEWTNFEEALQFAFSFSRGSRVIVEEFIEKKHKYLIGGDIFVINGVVQIWGLLNCHRDSTVNPLVPVGKSYPVDLTEADYKNVQDTLQKLVDKLPFENGAMNVELIIDKNDRVFPIDIGPRSGGNMIPDLMGYIFDVNIPELSVKIAMGEEIQLCNKVGKNYFATHNLHSNKNGIYKRIDFSQEIEKYIVRKALYKSSGDKVEYFDNASKALGIVFFNFNSLEEMNSILENINNYIHIVLE